ncbi:MAG: hypothetical protein ABEJ42_02785, partial [Halobacteriaceae archaeon]
MSDAGRSDERSSGALSFDVASDCDGLTIFDPIDRHELTLRTPDAVTPEPVAEDRFRFPVDGAVTLRSDVLEVPNVVCVLVRDATGNVVTDVSHFGEAELGSGSFSIELTSEVKTYIRVGGPIDIDVGADRTRIELDGTRQVNVGARSRHEQPAATITTTDDPRDMMRAISALGSALKTTSPERSYPTLRGHPPLVELGEELDVPVETPDTGVTITVPPEPRHVFPVSTLAYYLGATVEPGEDPRVETDRGFAYPLDGPEGFEATVERVLKQVFLFDCATRTEGLYRVPLAEREAVEAAVDLDFDALYDADLQEQLETYLSVPYEDIAAHVPEWKVATHVAPEPDNVELLPFAVDDLAVVRTAGVTATPESGTSPPSVGDPDDAQEAAIGNFLRAGAGATASPDGGTTADQPLSAADEFTRSASAAPGTRSAGIAGPGVPERIDPGERDSLELAWVAEGAPIGGSKPTVTAYRNGLEREPATGAIDITVVCNDPRMSEEEDTVSAVYGARDALPFDVEVHRQLTAEELRDVLAEPTDFLHYIGHIDGDGFECADGRLDAGSIDEVGVDAFLLNACQSYDQGMSLIEAGSIGGVVTLRDVVNSGAVEMGETTARLLNRGFSLRAALTIAADEQIVGNQYLVVGDGDI